MKSTFKVIFYVRRDKMKSDGTLPIFCGLTINKKRVFSGLVATCINEYKES